MNSRRHPSRPLLRALQLCAVAGLASGVFAQPLKPDDAPKQTPLPAPSAPARPTTSIEPSVERYSDRIVREVKLVGLSKTDPQLVRNQIRVRDGAPLNPVTVREDVQRLVRLARFKQIDARVQPYADGSILLTYDFLETPIITDVQAVGNRQIPDSEIASVINVLRDTPVDEYQLGAARSAIERLYRDKGYYQATVTIDQAELDKTGIVLFRINEGEQVDVTAIRFEGNASFDESQISPVIKTTTAGLFTDGPVDNDQLDRDVGAIVEFYRDRGYLDVRADRRVTFSPNGREAIVTFLVDEGPVYTLRTVRFEAASALVTADGKPAPGVFSREQIAGLLEIKAGDVYAANKIRRSVDTVRNAYARMGYVDVAVARFEQRDPNQPVVDLLIRVREGNEYRTGLITVSGNDLTKKSVIFRALDIRPDRPLDNTNRRVGERTVSESQQRLDDTRLFKPGSVRITIQDPDPADPIHRDVLIEIEEHNTGSLAFGVGVNSDLGLIGSITLNQRNFDIADTPDSAGELFTGKAFRGAGQDFSIVIAPGTETQTYQISLSDPHLFDTDYSGSIAGYYRTRNYSEFDESRLGGRASLGRRFGERWVGNLAARYELIDIFDIDADAPTDYFEVEGDSTLSGLGVNLTRNTTDSRFRPTRGMRLALSAECVGALGGDYNFFKLGADHIVFVPVYESFLGHKTVLSLKTKAQWIPGSSDEAPFFERYYMGGTTFRGFEFRTISPKGIANNTGLQSDDPVGGSWSFFIGPEIEHPVYKDIVSVVGFVDTGTVVDDIGFEDYRVSAGFGLRIRLDVIGPVPIALDFGFPIVKQYLDQERVFSFSIDLPF